MFVPGVSCDKWSRGDATPVRLGGCGGWERGLTRMSARLSSSQSVRANSWCGTGTLWDTVWIIMCRPHVTGAKSHRIYETVPTIWMIGAYSIEPEQGGINNHHPPTFTHWLSHRAANPFKSCKQLQWTPAYGLQSYCGQAQDLAAMS
ncbi:hypothetical protein JZ751_023794 [Albula glossodonta]|uniref:Uncharacterized protein n=1 Tax=Albula glossodonta TaxID=121402 RepID=A0A8T2NJF0_9TELE|nr:hypothetical protein JZ751_023794 [Albula glossodonta]